VISKLHDSLGMIPSLSSGVDFSEAMGIHSLGTFLKTLARVVRTSQPEIVEVQLSNLAWPRTMNIILTRVRDANDNGLQAVCYPVCSRCPETCDASTHIDTCHPHPNELVSFRISSEDDSLDCSCYSTPVATKLNVECQTDQYARPWTSVDRSTMTDISGQSDNLICLRCALPPVPSMQGNIARSLNESASSSRRHKRRIASKVSNFDKETERKYEDAVIEDQARIFGQILQHGGQLGEMCINGRWKIKDPSPEHPTWLHEFELHGGIVTLSCGSHIELARFYGDCYTLEGLVMCWDGRIVCYSRSRSRYVFISIDC
jgi:hypothetical protein